MDRSLTENVPHISMIVNKQILCNTNKQAYAFATFLYFAIAIMSSRIYTSWILSIASARGVFQIQRVDYATSYPTHVQHCNGLELKFNNTEHADGYLRADAILRILTHANESAKARCRVIRFELKYADNWKRIVGNSLNDSSRFPGIGNFTEN